MSHPKPSEKRKGLGAGIIAFGVVFALFSLCSARTRWALLRWLRR